MVALKYSDEETADGRLAEPVERSVDLIKATQGTIMVVAEFKLSCWLIRTSPGALGAHLRAAGGAPGTIMLMLMCFLGPAGWKVD